jgi:hypothetical protein
MILTTHHCCYHDYHHHHHYYYYQNIKFLSSTLCKRLTIGKLGNRNNSLQVYRIATTTHNYYYHSPQIEIRLTSIVNSDIY